jgi:hypothetical protein
MRISGLQAEGESERQEGDNNNKECSKDDVSPSPASRAASARVSAHLFSMRASAEVHAQVQLFISSLHNKDPI